MVDEYITAIYDRNTHLGYDYVYSINNTPKNDEEFQLHAHKDRYEIFLFLSGNQEFHIEGNVYRSHPGDLYIARPMEMHHNVFLSSDRYERIIIHIMADYFRENHCEELEQVFLNRTLGENCQIPAYITHREMYHLILKMNQYLQAGAYDIAGCVLKEFLYLLNHIEEHLTEPQVADSRIQNILLYLNSHLSEPLSLDGLSAQFYINKYYLCRIFKNITGYTINQYVNLKRLVLVQELHRQGQTFSEASLNAGFNSYSHFYKMYCKKFGAAPTRTEK